MKHKIKGHLAKTIFQVTALLPLSWSRRFGAFVGWWNVMFNSRMAKVTNENLRRCLPQLSDQERKTLVLHSMMETGKTVAETGAVWLKPYHWLKPKILDIHGLPLMEEKLAAQKGLLILAPHLGNWEVLGLLLPEIVPVTSMYQPPAMLSLDNMIRNGREKTGAKLVPTNSKGVMALLKSLKSGGVIAILPDQVPEAGSGCYAPFFGHNALTMTLAHKLIERTRCSVLFSYAKRVPGGFEICFQTVDDDIYNSDQTVALSALNRGIEHCVREIPAQYQWEYKRFKRQPSGEPKWYQFKK